MTTNPQIKKILDKQLENGRLAHAYLFVGPRGAGKRELAVEFARKVLESADLTVHPDYACLDCAGSAGAETVREFIGRIALKPFVAKRKFALISNIEKLNPFGANALLKTLEEPPKNTVMVLTADTRQVLTTIISRCQVFSFNPPSLKLRRASRGAAGGLLSISDFVGKSLAERLLAITRFKDLEASEFEAVVENFVYESAGALGRNPQDYSRLAAGLKAFEDLRTNKNRKLILQGLFMRI